MTIGNTRERQATMGATGDVNQDYPLPPDNTHLDHTYASPDMRDGNQTYQDLDGTQETRVYQDINQKQP